MIKPFICAALLLSISCNSQTNSEAATQKSKTEQQQPTASFIAANLPDSLSPKFGKYGCTATKYSGGGYYEYTPKGSFEITDDGHYTYYGFDKPSKGTYIVDEKGNLLFSSGYFDGGKAEKIDRPNKFFLVFPSIPDNRWTCAYIDK